MAKKPFGVLVIHGFTDILDSIQAIEPSLTALGLPNRMPLLRGHGGNTPKDLRGVTWQDWVSDAEVALKDLLSEVDRVIVIGYSMGGLVTLFLAADYAKNIDSIILAAPAVQLNSPLAPGRPLHLLAPLVKHLIKRWDMPPVYTDPELAKNHSSYPWAPMEAISTLLDFSVAARNRLADVHVPVLILQSHNDFSVSPKNAEIVYHHISTPVENKRIIWFDTTGHEMFRDCQTVEVVDVIREYIQERMNS